MLEILFLLEIYAKPTLPASNVQIINNMPEKSKRISFPKEVREYIFQRDNHQCQSCGQTTNLTIDHIIPLATGGSNDISNLQTLCGSCNSQKKHYFDPRFDRKYS